MIELGKNSMENMFIVSFPSPSVLLGGPLNIATNYFEGNLNYFFLPLSSLLLLLVAALLSLPSGGFSSTQLDTSVRHRWHVFQGANDG